jgi:hypothetical protein
MSEDSEFQQDLINYLESCHIGEFMTGAKDEIAKRIPLPPKNANKGIHKILLPEDEHTDVPNDYVDPTLTIPEAPPVNYCADANNCSCPDCNSLLSWYDRLKRTVDDILLRSNMHKCFGRRDNKEDESGDNNKSEGHIPKTHATGKGCINKDGVCTARFLRPLFAKSLVDPVTGHLNLKKLEEYMNNVTPGVTFSSRCNTDTTCLLSGTAVKATIGYVTDYITKTWLKTYQIFSTMYQTFNKNSELLEEEEKNHSSARRMVLKIVNSLSAKMEIGAPMAALYLLDNPDHYTSHEFVPFYWKNFITYIEKEWEIFAGQVDPETLVVGIEDAEDSVDVGVERVKRDTPVHDTDGAGLNDVRAEDRVQIRRANGSFVGKSSTDDYRNRPVQLEKVCLYEWIQCALRHNESSNRQPPKNLHYFRYLADHPLLSSHIVACDPDRRGYVVPNFIGPALPRTEDGDREQYCLMMLTFFCPWRTGLDLRSSHQTWEDAFNAFEFTARQRQLMNNFNIRYECYDAKDDFSAQYKSKGGDDTDDESDDDRHDEDVDVEYADLGDEMAGVDGGELIDGPATRAAKEKDKETVDALKHAGWSEFIKPSRSLRDCLSLPRIIIDSEMNATTWRSIIKGQKLLHWRKHFAAAGGDPGDSDTSHAGVVKNSAFVVPASYLSKEFVPDVAQCAQYIDDVVKEQNLNTEQEKAFRIVANHATCVGAEQLLMYLGGRGGTGKSRVIRALETYFRKRKEPYCFIILAPTGTAAALIGGTTYHSFLGLRTGQTSADSFGSIGDLKDRLRFVAYLLINEVSMLCCMYLCRISARLCEALQVFEKPFGGLNVILAGDFAQLPPAGNELPLYSRRVTMKQTPRQDVTDQEDTIGRAIWWQFTTVVILKQNMRQLGAHTRDAAFREALSNLRYHACTPADIELICSRIASSSNGLSVDHGSFKNVSIITARNRDKDQMNDSQSVRFAKEVGHELEDFYSVDKLTTTEAKRRRGKAKGKKYSKGKRISREEQEALWRQAPSTSDHIPGRLRLCRGMPVIIRYNNATELCITRGQEARVVGWTYSLIPAFHDRKRLEVLYVELTKPPHSVKLPNLPINVVPLTRMAQSVEARLPSDLYMTLSRSQVPVLPNFSMTDYSSQGKTRDFNVIDLKNCKNFQAAYTCLSRGTSVDGTLILHDFDDVKLTRSLDGELRQEFRELNYLDLITDMRYHGTLPEGILQNTRRNTINRFKRWYGTKVEGTWHHTISKATSFERDSDDEETLPRHPQPSPKKRKAKSTVDGPRKKTQRPMSIRTSWNLPVGPVWDSRDYSCAFDVWTFIMHTLWRQEKRWINDWCLYSAVMQEVMDRFERMRLEDPEDELTAMRDGWHGFIRSIHPEEYPPGIGGVDIFGLSRHIVGNGRDAMNRVANTECKSCKGRYTSVMTTQIPTSRYLFAENSTSVQDLIASLHEMQVRCPCGGALVVVDEPEPLICVELDQRTDTVINARVELPLKGCYRLAGMVYFGHFHFTARVVTLDGKVYMHDGMSGAYSTYEGAVDGSFKDPEMWRYCQDRRASVAIYVLEG